VGAHEPRDPRGAGIPRDVSLRLGYERTNGFGDLVLGSAIYAVWLVYPLLVLGVTPLLIVLWRKGRVLPRPRQRRLALTLAPLVGAPIALIGLAAGDVAILPWYAACTLAYAFLLRLPADFDAHKECG